MCPAAKVVSYSVLRTKYWLEQRTFVTESRQSAGCTPYSMPRTAYSVQRTPYSVLRTEYSHRLMALRHVKLVG